VILFAYRGGVESFISGRIGKRQKGRIVFWKVDLAVFSRPKRSLRQRRRKTKGPKNNGREIAKKAKQTRLNPKSNSDPSQPIGGVSWQTED